MPAPLHGLRVLELATGVAGPYAGRLLVMLGAEVVKLEPADGDPARTIPVDDEPPGDVSPLYVHLNLGKRNVRRSGIALGDALTWAKVVIDDRVRRQVSGTESDPERLQHEDLALVSVTAWGFDASEPGTVHDELIVQAASGVMTVTGDDGDAPLRFPGWQSQYLAGGYAAASALAAVHAGGFHHLDVSWVASMATGAEGGFTRALHSGVEGRPAGPHPLEVVPSGAMPCADGHVVPGTVRRHDWESQATLYGMPELLTDERFKHQQARARNWPDLKEAILPWYARHAKREIFERALELGLALGMVVTPTDALTDPHMSARGFLSETGAPARPWITEGLPVAGQRLAAHGEHDAWFGEAVRS